jgi:FAD:protein FMN transferase
MEAAHVSIRRARPLLGTFVEIAVAGATIDVMEAAVEAAFSAVAAVHRLMSFHEAGSDVSRLNREAASGTVRVHDWTYQVLEIACDLNRRSGGMFDVSVAPALQRLGLLPSELAAVPPHPAPLHSPSKAGINALKASGERDQKACAAGTVQLLPENQVRFADHSVKIDLGGIAKGFAVDRAVEALRRHGVADGLVNAGGDLRTFGPREHEIDIRDPRHPDRIMCRVALRNAALASSGSRFDPLRSGHLLNCAVIDPATAMPVRSIHGATVCAPSCVIADALTKLVMNVGEAAARLLDHYGADALFVSTHGDVHMTAPWKNEVHLAA